MKEIKLPKDFVLGVATSSYQIEGDRQNLDSCIWDEFAKIPGKVCNEEDGHVACDHVHQMEKDVALLRQLNIKYYRFSITWTRVFKNGVEKVNEEGLHFYKKLIKLLKENDIVPVVTLYHWDLPTILQEKGGWENEESIGWFLKFARLIFETFQNDVGYYVTINEPFCIANLGYKDGFHAPGLNSVSSFLKASKNLLVAHGKAVQLFKELGYVGKIGICLNIADVRAVDEEAQKELELINDLKYDWYLKAIFTGNFPKQAVKYYEKLGYKIDLSEEEKRLISIPTDFIGLNHYNPEYYDKKHNFIDVNYYKKNSLNWLVDSKSLSNVIKKIASLTTMDILVLENGYCSNYKNKEKEINDDERVEYIQNSLLEIQQCIEQGIHVKGYFAWSLLDNYEWTYGYSQRFGLVYVDYQTQERIIKKSGYFLQQLSKKLYDRKLVFHDEFHDLDNWNVIVSGGGFGNDENQYYVKENMELKDGLTIIGKKEDKEKYHYTSSKIVSKKEFMYGRFEIVAKIPSGCGAWPAIWMLPKDIKEMKWPNCGEIDIMEEVGRNPNVIHFSLHTKNYNHILKTQRTAFFKVEDASFDYKKYSMEWNENYIEFFIDNVSYARFDKNDPKYLHNNDDWPFDKPYQLIINLAIGGYWGRPIKDDELPFYFQIKSVDIYR